MLVVDADIAGAAGPDPKTRPWSDAAKAAHDVLYAVRESRGYRALVDSTLLDEWKRHQGRTAEAWFASMLSAGRVRSVDRLDTSWIEALIREQLPAPEHKAALKDAHLVALASEPGDERILSNDHAARRKHARLDDERLHRIHWVGASDDSARWLREGAPARREWTLGHSEVTS